MTEEPRGREAEVLKARRESLEHLRAEGIEPFALSFEKDADAAELHARFGEMAADTLGDERFAVAGRIVMKRDIGKLVFLVLRDSSGAIQLVCNQADMNAELLADVDLGETVGARGRVGATKKGGRAGFVAER